MGKMSLSCSHDLTKKIYIARTLNSIVKQIEENNTIFINKYRK